MKTRSIVMAVAVAALAGCASTMMDGPRATAQLQPTRGNTTAGTVTFTQHGGKVAVAGTITGLAPNSAHGFHIHERGDCTSGDGMSAGGHFNPEGRPHGNPMSGPHHAGDLPMLQADATGTAVVRVDIEGFTVSDGPLAIVGRGLIVHAQPDDYKTQPTGNSGARLACAVIQRS